MVRAVVGANWGDEGKGKITDMLAERADIIVRFQGGANAGHTIINDYGKFPVYSIAIPRASSEMVSHWIFRFSARRYSLLSTGEFRRRRFWYQTVRRW